MCLRYDGLGMSDNDYILRVPKGESVEISEALLAHILHDKDGVVEINGILTYHDAEDMR